MTNIKDTDLAWLAGFLDGEGTIGISRCNNKMQPHPYLRPHLQAPNTDRRLIEHMGRIIEGVTGKTQSITRPPMPAGQKTMYRLRVGTQWELAILIPLLLPYVVSKKRQSQLVLEFCQRKLGRNGGHRWYEFKEQDEAAYLECLALNKRGVPIMPETKPAVLKLVANGQE